MAATTEYVLQYFPLRGRAECIRYLLAYGQLNWTNKFVQFEEWAALKPTIPMGGLPVLDFEGKRLCQSLVIGRFLATRIGIAGSDEWARGHADMLVEGLQDVIRLFGPYSVAFRSNNQENIKIERENLKAALKPWFEIYENFLGDKQWFCNEFTWADIVMAEFVDRIERCIAAGFVDDYPKLKAHAKRVHELANIAKYVNSRQEYLF